MNLSIVMSTFNRPNDTLRFLENLEKTVTRQGTQWEAIVVDNGSTDNTRDVVASYIARAGYPLRLFTERAIHDEKQRRASACLPCFDRYADLQALSQESPTLIASK